LSDGREKIFAVWKYRDELLLACIKNSNINYNPANSHIAASKQLVSISISES